MPIREIARAKVNLTLRVLGRRRDGYHEIESLVAFAEVGDVVELTPGLHGPTSCSGPFAAGIVGDNLLDRALDLLGGLDAGLTLGTVHLEKNLPVAAGLGGGSADAAALLRAVRRANPGRGGDVPWHDLAVKLGADVAACLAGVPAVIRGIGDRLEPLGPVARFAPIPAVLANPGLPLATADVYRALAAPPVGGDSRQPLALGASGTVASLVALMRERGNDLEPPATRLFPAIADAKTALAAQPGCLLAAMSGSGPTCFAVFADDAAASHAAAALAGANPRWWVAATRLGAGE
jgi:4-diphosphocytidyl-2-C-methyl-D-erythritol kinase